MKPLKIVWYQFQRGCLFGHILSSNLNHAGNPPVWQGFFQQHQIFNRSVHSITVTASEGTSKTKLPEEWSELSQAVMITASVWIGHSRFSRNQMCDSNGNERNINAVHHEFIMGARNFAHSVDLFGNIDKIIKANWELENPGMPAEHL